MSILFPLYLFLAGIVLGSFCNVVGLRLPQNAPFITSRSACPSCSTTLSAGELIPVASYMIRKAKCRHCKTRISLLYPAGELFTGVFLLLSYNHFGWTVELLEAGLLLSLAVIVTISDVKYMVIPNRLLVFSALAFTVLRVFHPLQPWYDPLAGAGVGFALVFFIIFLSRGGMGAGDMKLLAVLGLFFGVRLTLLTLFLAVAAGAVVSTFLLAAKMISRRQPFPFGPFLMAGALISFYYGDALTAFYLRYFIQP
ncbi:prepilin peptidase [Halobacillus litoralis]|uniref:prepilin peptidase n=1 Tax=Halobacillus litoralis TaxID=45668 RepID=UPI001CD3C590|nr:A24 family peptidase [Halobacillus litoralis]MCA1021736.1 A24 family peptidase [Halobacillus litoralis]